MMDWERNVTSTKTSYISCTWSSTEIFVEILPVDAKNVTFNSWKSLL